VQAEDLVLGETEGYDPEAHEEEPNNLSAGISIQNLTKIYDEVNFELYVTYTCIHGVNKIAWCKQDSIVRIMYYIYVLTKSMGECSMYAYTFGLNILLASFPGFSPLYGQVLHMTFDPTCQRIACVVNGYTQSCVKELEAGLAF